MKRHAPAAERAAPEALLNVMADAMPSRVEPRCRHFGACGGCQLQHLDQASQLAAKQQMVTAVLQRAGLKDVPATEVHAADPWQYRNRARMRVVGGEIGYSKRSSNDFLPIQECPIVSPLVWRAADALRSLAQAGLARWPVGTASVEVFANSDDSQCQLSFFVDATVGTVDRGAPAALRAVCDALHSRLPELAGAGLLVSANPDPSLSRRVQESQRVEIARWGEAGLLYRVAGTEYHVTRNAFFQVNRFLTGTMQQLVTSARSGRLAYDLFAGAGLFSVPLTAAYRQVTAVEIGEPAASDLDRHMRACGVPHQAVKSTALAFLQQGKPPTAPDLVVVDPPRAGLGMPTAKALAATGAAEIVYVSCDAATFALDSRTLVESGYTMAALHLLDLFPQTFHTETIALFRR